MLIGILYFLFVLACLILVATVLLQPGKADAGALFTSNISSTAFGPRGTQTILSKITIGAAAAFMILAFLLSQPALTGNRSVLETTGTTEGATEPATSGNENNAVTTATPDQATPQVQESNQAPAVTGNVSSQSNQAQPSASNSNQ